MQAHEAPREELKTRLSLSLVQKLWREVERRPLASHPKDLSPDSFLDYVLPYANALCWLRHLATQEGEGARVSIVQRAFAREGDDDPESEDLAPVERALGPRLVALLQALDLEGLPARELLSPTEQEGMWSLDERAARFLEAEGQKESAEWVRRQAKGRWKNYQGASELETPRSQVLARRGLWWLWESEELAKAQEPPLVLAHLIARGLVKAHKKRLDVAGWNQAARLVSLQESRHLKQLSLGYCAREFVLCGLPYKPTKANEFVRQNGDLRLKVYGDPKLGIPYGQDRLITVWLASAFQAAGKPANNRIYFRSASDILRAFEIPIDGHERQLLKERLQRVFKATYVVELKEKRSDGSVYWNARRYQLITEVRLWFDQKEVTENQYTLESAWRNYIELDPYFAQDLRLRSLPIDIDTIVALKRSPAVLDFYAWQAWRSYRLLKSHENEVRIPIFGPNGLWVQFGSQTLEKRKAKQLLRQWQTKLKMYWPECPNELTSDAEWIIIRPAIAVHKNAKLTLPGVSRRPPQLAKKEAPQLEAKKETHAKEDQPTPTPLNEVEELAQIHLLRPPGQDSFPDED